MCEVVSKTGLEHNGNVLKECFYFHCMPNLLPLIEHKCVFREKKSLLDKFNFPLSIFSFLTHFAKY